MSVTTSTVGPTLATAGLLVLKGEALFVQLISLILIIEVALCWAGLLLWWLTGKPSQYVANTKVIGKSSASPSG